MNGELLGALLQVPAVVYAIAITADRNRFRRDVHELRVRARLLAMREDHHPHRLAGAAGPPMPPGEEKAGGRPRAPR